MKVVFYYLSAFASTGGIEKFNRCFMKALTEIESDEFSSTIVSAYDGGCDERYTNSRMFKGFAGKRSKSVVFLIRQALHSQVLIIGHINLAIAGVIVKLMKPKCKLVIIAHGIEIWGGQKYLKKRCLQQADIILAVSNYTKNQLVLNNKVDPSRIQIFPNTIDPYFRISDNFAKPNYLFDRYKLKQNQHIVLTLSRLVTSEQYKGYDKVIESLPAILEKYPTAVYLLAGKYDSKEKWRINNLVKLYGLENKVILAGFIADDEVSDHYKLADVFIMPSRKEGFGIVFLEALACGAAVIGGNQDGTVDALKNGALGLLINPTKTQEIVDGVLSVFDGKLEHQPELLQEKVFKTYGFPFFKQRLKSILLK